MMMVSQIIAQPHERSRGVNATVPVGAIALCIQLNAMNNGLPITPKNPKSTSGFSESPVVDRMAPSTSSAFGPTNTRVCVCPETSPIAAPRKGSDVMPLGATPSAGIGANAWLRASVEALPPNHVDGDKIENFDPTTLSSVISWLCRVATVAVCGASGRKIVAKYWSLTPAQSNGPFSVLPPDTFLNASCSSFPFWDVSICAAA